jgi:hypothetical protein
MFYAMLVKNLICQGFSVVIQYVVFSVVSYGSNVLCMCSGVYMVS